MATGCADNFLELTNQNELTADNFYTKIENFDLSLNATYDAVKNHDLFGQTFYVQTLLALPHESDYWNAQNRNEVTSIDGNVYIAWRGFFRIVARANDIIGNAREWVMDCFTASYAGRPADARAWTWQGGCELKGVRGGSFASRPRDARAPARGAEMAGHRQSDLGFRVARDY